MILLQTLPNDLFTVASMCTLAGATAITSVITNSCQHAFNWNPKWLGLVVAILVMLVGAALTPDAKAVNYVMAVINGFLSYASAAGIMQMAGTPIPQPPANSSARSFRTPIRRFSSKWF
jgi:hypothetical protein